MELLIVVISIISIVLFLLAIILKARTSRELRIIFDISNRKWASLELLEARRLEKLEADTIKRFYRRKNLQTICFIFVLVSLAAITYINPESGKIQEQYNEYFIDEDTVHSGPSHQVGPEERTEGLGKE
jgi:hypothetical protein